MKITAEPAIISRDGDYIIKGFAMDDERLKNDGSILNKQYFEEQLQRIREIPMTMADWEERLNRFIEATDREVLQDAGRVSAEIARAHADCEFEKYRIIQDQLFESDFDKEIKKILSASTEDKN